MDVTLDQAACELLAALMHPATPGGEFQEVRLQWGDGHSGHGLYASLAEYPEEGAEMLWPPALRDAQDEEAGPQNAVQAAFGGLVQTPQG